MHGTEHQGTEHQGELLAQMANRLLGTRIRQKQRTVRRWLIGYWVHEFDKNDGLYTDG